MSSARRFILGIVVVLTIATTAPVAGAATLPSHPSGHWTWQRTGPQGNDLTAVYAVAPGEMWAAGSAGTLLHTSDGGATWASIPTGSTAILTDVTFGDTEHGWVVSAAGDVLRTTDGGADWTMVRSGTSPGFAAASFTDDRSGWAGSCDTWGIYKTTDGGADWTRRFPSSDHVNLMPWLGHDISAVSFADSSRGWAAGGAVHRIGTYTYGTGRGTIVRTTDGGETWTLSTPPRCRFITDLAALDAQTAVACNGRGVLRTTDGGTSWQTTYSGSSEGLDDLDFVSASEGWAVGGANEVLHTTDGGATWQTQPAPGFPRRDLLGVSFSDAQHGWIVGAAGAILNTSDGGATWSWCSSPIDRGLVDIAFVDAQTGVAVGSREDGIGLLSVTTDGGSTWTDVASPAVRDLWDVTWASPTDAWAVGTEGAVVHTADGGKTWQRQRTPGWGWLTGVAFSDRLHGWAIDSDAWSRVLVTTDGGVAWRYQRFAVPRVRYLEPNAITFTDDHDGWIVGEAVTSGSWRSSGAIVRTTDAGTTWTRVGPTLKRPYADVAFCDTQHGWIATGGRELLSTTDGGATWATLKLPTASRAIDVELVDPQHGWVVLDAPWGRPSVVLATTDAGEHWGVVPTGYASTVPAVSFADPLNGWIACFGGGVLHTSDGGGIMPIAQLTTSPSVSMDFSRVPVTMHLTCVDDGRGAAGCEYRLDGGPWTAATDFVLDARNDHTTDGLHTVLYRGIDGDGAKGDPGVRQIVIDTQRPTVTAPRSVAVRRGSVARIPAGVADRLSPWALVTVTIKGADGRTVARRSTSLLSGDIEPLVGLVRVRCGFSPGRYRLTITGRDLAGNRQKRIASNWLTVRPGGSRLVDPAKDAALKEAIHMIQVGVQSWAVDHGDLYPPATEVTRDGAVGKQYLDRWPTNPFTGQPMTPGSAPGCYTYRQLDGGNRFVLIGHLSTGGDFRVP